MTIIKQVLQTDMPAIQRMVVVSLASFLNEKQRSAGCWPLVATLVKTVGATDRTIQSHLIAQRGKPGMIVSDNGTELTSTRFWHGAVR